MKRFNWSGPPISTYKLLIGLFYTMHSCLFHYGCDMNSLFNTQAGGLELLLWSVVWQLLATVRYLARLPIFPKYMVNFYICVYCHDRECHHRLTYLLSTPGPRWWFQKCLSHGALFLVQGAYPRPYKHGGVDVGCWSPNSLPELQSVPCCLEGGPGKANRWCPKPGACSKMMS
jgi:hypothetical protein